MTEGMMEIPFYKLHGNGNDFILIDELNTAIIPDEMKADFAALFCDRHYGIGGDGVIYLTRSENTDLKMRLFQPDKSEAEMCGNGMRCFAKYAYDAGYIGTSGRIETLAGIIPVRAGYGDDEFLATVTMPKPLFDRKEIPATGEGEYRETILGLTVQAVNIGVPHAVIFVDSVDGVDIGNLGPAIRRHETFPKGANVNFVERTSQDALKIRTFERGVEDETLSCGTGATAAAAIAHKLGFVGTQVHVETIGGPLTVHLGEETLLEGPAVTVFSGLITF
jgi:diaminopimelate epimerase